jgi:dCTP deaminase
MLSDASIIQSLRKQEMSIFPWNADNLQPASYDVTLDTQFLLPSIGAGILDLAKLRVDHMTPYDSKGVGVILRPGEFILGCTREVITLGNMHVARIEGKSSLGRLGLLVHVTAGFIDPGFSGQVTLEIVNAAPWTIILYPGQKIAQIAFDRLDMPPEKVYGQAGNHYQNQRGPVESRFKLTRSIDDSEIS